MTTEERIEKYVHLLHDSLGANNTATHQELTNPASVVIDDFKTLSFVCDAADNAISVTINGVTVTYPKATASGVYVLGENLVCDKENRFPVTFSGTGTVIITKQSRK